jgi:D-glycero-D-manno-heptose 1,7-bisphosphate phosphatase
LNEPSSPTHRPPTTVFLDRDGVINRKPPEGDYVERWEQFEFLPGAIEALALLAAAGIRAVVVTNQRGVALGRMTLGDLDDIHRRMQAELEIGRASCRERV